VNLTYSTATDDQIAGMRALRDQMAAAATGAIRDAGDQIKREGRANIAAAGFSSKWQNTLRVNIYPNKGASLDPAALAYHKIPYSAVFEEGATISGSPLLWLPLRNVPKSLFGRHMSPANFNRLIGPLIKFKGRNLLGAYMAPGPITIAKLVAGNRGRKQRKGLILVPLFFGIDSVTLTKRFNLRAVFNKAAAGLRDGYFRNLKPLY
jgi:hypothetical protein